MNCFNGFTLPVAGGYHAMLRFAEDGQAEPALGEGGKPIIFATELEAQRAVTQRLLAYFNGRYRRDGDKAVAARAAAEDLFRKGRRIVVDKVGGKSRRKAVREGPGRALALSEV